MKRKSWMHDWWKVWRNKFPHVQAGKQPHPRSSIQPPDCNFVLSVERGKLESQAILLVESLRRFGGRYANCPVYAVSPRPSWQMSPACQKILKSLGVHLIIEDLLSMEERYGSIGRLAACTWAEKNL